MVKCSASGYQLRLPKIAGALFLAIALAFTGSSVVAKAKKSKSEVVVTEEAESGEATTREYRQVTLSLKQLGAWSSLQLRGVDGTQSLAFPIRSDEVVVSAKLRIAYDYSPALIPELSHLQIALNDRIATVENLPKDKGVGNTRDIQLDPRLFRDNNTLQFKLIGHYTRQCEDPYHSSLWLTLSDLGRLELTLAPVSSSSDLRKLPLPFFDSRENTALTVPFVFAKTPSSGTLQAAGVVASWFGLQARNKGMQFPVSINELPDGNAVVFLQAGESVEGIKGIAASTVAIVPHPKRPTAKLLLVTGSNEAEIARAAHAIALASRTLAGQSVTVTKEIEAAPRKPYDAPAWVPLDRPVRLGELLAPEQMRVHTYYPDAIRLNYRIAPDLFTWHSAGVPLNLKFRSTRLPYHHNSSLNVGLNGNFVQALALNEPTGKSADQTAGAANKIEGNGVRQEQIMLPPYASSGRDQLQLSYYFDVIKDGECRGLPPDNLEGSIDPGSTVDFSQFPHFAALPNLAYFAQMGYPFTRLADLSETAVVLPDAPNSDEIGLYLTIMGRMGESTGYPALRVAVTNPIGMEKMGERDLLVVSSANNQSLITKWKNYLPMVVIDGVRQVREAVAHWYPTYRWGPEDTRSLPNPAGELQLAGNASISAIMAFESPLQAGRSVVYFFADKSADLRKINDLMSDPERIPTVRGDFVVVDDKAINHAQVSATYYVGTVPFWQKLRWFMAEQPMVFGLLALLACVLAAVLAYRPLRRLLDQRAKQ
jgi:Bacterial cellulose synthase subunit